MKPRIRNYTTTTKCLERNISFTKVERNARIISMRAEGKSNREIGEAFNISPQRVSVICKKGAK